MQGIFVYLTCSNQISVYCEPKHFTQGNSVLTGFTIISKKIIYEKQFLHHQRGGVNINPLGSMINCVSFQGFRSKIFFIAILPQDFRSTDIYVSCPNQNYFICELKNGLMLPVALTKMLYISNYIYIYIYIYIYRVLVIIKIVKIIVTLIGDVIIPNLHNQ